MINLIPPSAKADIRREYWARVTTVWVFICSGVAFVIAILLIPVYVLINSQINVYAEAAEAAISENTKFQLSSASLIQASQRARLLTTLADEERFTDLVTLLDSIQNQNVTITTFEFSRTQTEPVETAPILITGTALTRQALADFRTALLNHPAVDTALLPISNLTLDRDIIFSVTITMKKE
jgi:hypothetical protein